MRIAQISTVHAPIREAAAESVEGLLWLLTRELSAMGHEVTVFGVAGSEAPGGQVVETLPGPYGTNGAPDDWELCEWLNISRAVERAGEFDVLHSHAYLWGLTLQGLCPRPMLHTMHVTPYDDHARLWRLTPGALVSAISRAQWSRFPDVRPVDVIHHGVDPSRFTLNTTPADYLCYLGRFIEDKGPLEAIAAARAAGMRLVMAGPRSEYFDEVIAPHVDGDAVQYRGFVGPAERDELLGNAAALLYPVRDPEPFGLVLVEAMMCGTPVVASPIGAVAEIVEDGVTGYYAHGAEDFPRQIERARLLDRARVRRCAEERFSARRMAEQYADLYRRIAVRHG